MESGLDSQSWPGVGISSGAKSQTYVEEESRQSSFPDYGAVFGGGKKDYFGIALFQDLL